MTFNSFIGIGFTIIVVIIYSLLRGRRLQNIFLLITSLMFYAYGEPILVTLLIACISVSYVGGLVIADRPKYAKLAFWVSLLIVLGVLGLFKYFNFFVDTFERLFATIGLPFQRSTLEIVLPIGISFYTFQSVGYLADVYRKRHAPERDFLDYALFLSFFPHLVAGPIERTTNLLDQVKRERVVTADDVSAGLFMIAQGFVKKTVIADNVAPYADFLFSRGELSAPLIIAGCLAFAVQIYCDFSGYTDIARGVSRLMGFRILLNFLQPYWSKSPTEFWRRWHITLSNWFRDYVYIPLGGNRKGVVRSDVNAFITMTVSGLWHGAAMNFVLWGMFHGVALIAHRYWDAAGLSARFSRIPFYPLLAWAVTMTIVGYGWLLFRVSDWGLLVEYNRALVSNWAFPSLGLLVAFQILPYVVLTFIVDVVERLYMDDARINLLRGASIAVPIAMGLLLVLFFGSETGGAFIYFQF